VICASQFATPDNINFAGCAGAEFDLFGVTGDRLDRLELPLAGQQNTDNNQETAFTVSTSIQSTVCQHKHLHMKDPDHPSFDSPGRANLKTCAVPDIFFSPAGDRWWRPQTRRTHRSLG
jgi:3,4-dihydroxy-2-butanone 4-phosphate synthase